MANRILVVDDELEIRHLVASYLKHDGFVVEDLDNGAAVLERLTLQPSIDLIVMDIRMPELDGIDALRELRRDTDIPVILLTAASDETDRLVGLSVGADDYVTKPFSPRELVARVKAVLRRSNPATKQNQLSPPLSFAGIEVDIDQHIVTVDDVEADLSALQFKLLVTLAESPGRVFSRHQLIDRVWGRDFFGEERIVDVHVGNLRKALGDDASSPRFIETVRGVGYRFIA